MLYLKYLHYLCFELGSFGTLILQVPVANGFQGGNFYVKNGKRTSKHLKTRNNHRSFHVFAFYDDCEITQSLETGHRMEFVFTLCHKSLMNSDIPPALKDDPKSPLYCIWQSAVPSNPSSENEIQVSEKQRRFQDLFSSWKNESQIEAQLYVIPLLAHSYHRKSLSPSTLKGIDRLLADVIVSLLGDFAEIHFATLAKYVGFNEDDRTQYWRLMDEKDKGKNCGELDWTEYLAGNWSNLNNLKLNLPPLRMTTPDKFLGMVDGFFEENPLDPSLGSMDGDKKMDRAAIIIWPRSKAFEIALRFGLDQALDVAERDSQIDCSIETRRSKMQRMLAYCEKNFHEAWFVNHQLICSDFRCKMARKDSIPVASLRALRLINLCLQWNLVDCGLELIRILFTDFDHHVYCCFDCSDRSGCNFYPTRPFFVGGVRSNAVAAALADLIVVIDWESAGISNIIQGLHTQQNFVKQAGQLAHLAICLFHRQCFAGAQYISNEAYTVLTTKFLVNLYDSSTCIMEKFAEAEPRLSTLKESVASVIDMLVLIDGPSFSEESRFDRLNMQLRTLNLC